MQNGLIAKTEAYVKNAFIENPHYSFGHWSVMYDHSVLVKDFALKIAENVECNKTLVAIGGLFHDIGKTYKADEETLHYDHEKFNLPVTEKFISALPLDEEEKNKLKSIVSYNDDFVEMKIVKDADALAFFADKRLYMLFLAWAVEKKLTATIQRKLDKFEKLRFPVSVEMGKEPFAIMKKDWAAYFTEHEFKFHI
jgi:putative nucleotidyltransferase with HDIG domain